jgi:hypothetical protein
MSRWSDLAVWRGPTPNQSGAMREQRGLVVHIAEGYFEGTIAWQRNPDANVSSHFIVAADGRIAQMVDTDVTAWTQSAGNGHWLSVENAGFTPNALTPQQVEANAQLLARGHLVYGYPLTIAVNPDGKGLGHHSMGCNWPGGAWGHCDCPGPAIIGQKPAILARATEIVTGKPTTKGQTMLLVKAPDNIDGGRVYKSDSHWREHLTSYDALVAAQAAGHPLVEVATMADLEALAGPEKPPSAPVALSAADRAAIVADLLAGVTPLLPTPQEIAVAVANGIKVTVGPAE